MIERRWRTYQTMQEMQELMHFSSMNAWYENKKKNIRLFSHDN
jgi:hypothetical protein